MRTDWVFKGKTNYSNFQLNVKNTSRIVFNEWSNNNEDNFIADKSKDAQNDPARTEEKLVYLKGESNKYYNDVKNITNIENFHNYVTNNIFSLTLAFSLFAIGATILSIVLKRDKSKKSKK